MFRRPTQELAGLEGSEIAIVPGVGHVCSVEAPEEFNRLALDFMGRTARAKVICESGEM
jgi:pimeloyl-ACP methyl ester carboxylesterase